MKKIILSLIISILFYSCIEETKPTTYQIVNNLTEWKQSNYWELFDEWVFYEDDFRNITYQDTIYDIYCECYDNVDKLIRTDTIYKLAKFEESNIIEVTPNIVKIKISSKFLPIYHKYYNISINLRTYYPTKYEFNYLTPNENTKFEIHYII